jgi:hypothetical protein
VTDYIEVSEEEISVLQQEFESNWCFGAFYWYPERAKPLTA